MEMTGQVRIEAPREVVWEALNDPEVLKASIPGCESLEKTGDNGFAAKVKAKIGPVSATFGGSVTLSDINPPESYTISGEGKGGAAGFAKGGAKVRLEPEGDATILHYDVTANVGGKMAQLGARLIDGTARKMADDFFRAFGEQVMARQGKTTADPAPPPPEQVAPVEVTPASDREPAPQPAIAPEAMAASAEPPPAATPPAAGTAAGATEADAPSPARAAEQVAMTKTPVAAGAAAHEEPAATARPAPATPPSGGIPGWAWVAGAVVVLAIVLALVL